DDRHVVRNGCIGSIEMQAPEAIVAVGFDESARTIESRERLILGGLSIVGRQCRSSGLSRFTGNPANKHLLNRSTQDAAAHQQHVQVPARAASLVYRQSNGAIISKSIAQSQRQYAMILRCQPCSYVVVTAANRMHVELVGALRQLRCSPGLHRI